jgi:hypothetical protein
MVLWIGERVVKEEEEMLTSVETLNFEGRIGGFEGFKDSHNKSAFSHTL